MNAVTVWQGIEERLRTVDGLRNVLLGEPSSVHDWPAVYGAYERFTHPLRNSPPSRSTLSSFTHIFVLRLCVQWVDNPQAEMQLLTLLTAIPLAIDADPKLGGRVGAGQAYIDEGTAGFAKIGGAECRVVDYIATVTEKE